MWTVQFLQGEQKAKNSVAENVALVVFLSKEVDEQHVAYKRGKKDVWVGIWEKLKIPGDI